MGTISENYRERLCEALENQFLRQTLDNFFTAYRTGRKNAFKGLDPDALAHEIGELKGTALPNLMELFEEFRKNAEAKGIHVHIARTAHEANDLIARIAADNDVKTIIKSKSMTAEETHLNPYLEEKGYEVTETDLGEWIIQLRNEGPSHMVMPAIHLSRKQVAQDFEKVTGDNYDVEAPEVIEELVKVARKELRPKYLGADMGVSGANFAIAESGTIGLVTNEGNARLTTTLPRVHVAIAGFEKLTPTLHDALKVLRVLPKNATGQILTSYVTWITGANECGPGPDGKKEMHIIFLDNGRLTLAQDPVFSEALRCIRCGACANVCPLYRLVGGHRFGHVYIGAIGLILTFFYHGKKNARDLLQNCLNCQACRKVCAAGIDLPSLIKEAHKLVLEEDGRPLKNKAVATMLKNRKLFHAALRAAWLAQKPLSPGQPVIRHLPFFFGKEHEFRSLPKVARVPLRDRWKKIARKVENPSLRVAFFAGCVTDFVYPEQGEAFLKLVGDRNIEVTFATNQTCCGLPAQMMGESETARDVALQNIEAIDPAEYDYIVTLCASCGSHIKEHYPALLKDKSGHDAKAQLFADKMIDFSSFARNVLGLKTEDFFSEGTKTTYHAPCHLCRGLEVTEEPRALLNDSGLEYIPCEEEDVCCGFGGSFSVTFPELSGQVLAKKIQNIEATGADQVVTDCPGCVMQLSGGLDKHRSRVKARHICEALADSLKRK